MNITTTSTGNSVWVAKLEGNLDTNSSPAAEETLSELVGEDSTKLLVNFGAVDFVSSAGLRILLVMAKRLGSTGGELRISDLNETVEEVFEISGFSTILNVFPTEEAALKGF